MVILLNIDCCGGKGFEKWNKIKNHFAKSEIVVLRTTDSGVKTKLKNYIESGETQFVAAGGDGTVNYMLNSLVSTAIRDQLKNITIGAIGIGSSNDFHKPFFSMIEGIPVCLDYQNAHLRDVGVIKYDSDEGKVEKYFLINASVGITAEANNLFNKSDLILHKLKQLNTKTAILYSAIKTIMNYKYLSAEIFVNGDKLNTSITNLGITKNPHFSGDLCYDSQADYISGKFDVHLAHDMNRYEVLNMMKALTHNNFSELKKAKSWQTDRIKIASENNFAVEFDGEVIIVKEVEFKILKKFIKVCGYGKSI